MEVITSSGVSQGSILGPTMWNVMFDGLLRLDMPSDIELIAFADDVTVVGKAPTTQEIKDLLEESIKRI